MSTQRRTPRTESFVAAASAMLLATGSLLAISSPAVAADGTVVTSADFQDGTTGNWEPSGDTGSTSGVVSLGKVLEVTGRSADYQSPTRTLEFDEGVTYTLSAKLRLAGDVEGGTNARFVVVADGTYTWVADTSVNSADWTTITGEYTPGGTDEAGNPLPVTDEVRVYFGTGNVAGYTSYDYLVDDIVISDGSGGELVNSDFEDGEHDGWVPDGGASLAVVDDNVYAVSARANSYDGIQTEVELVAGETYAMSYRIRLADGVDGSTSGRIIAHSLDPEKWTWVGNTPSITADAWTRVSGTLTIDGDENADGDYQLYVETDDIADRADFGFLVDDILVTTAADESLPPLDENFVPGGAVNPTLAPVSAAQGSGNVAALTFDDGPNGDDTIELLDFLKQKNIQAVFCVIGQNITASGGADVLQRIVADGHLLCNHSTGYDDMGGWTAAQVQQDLVENLEIIRTALGDPNAEVPYFRAPNGSWGATPAVAVALGMQPLAVTNTINDWATQDVDELETNLRNAMVAGQIVLAHDGGGDRAGTIAAVKTVVEERLAEGWEFTLPLAAGPSVPGGQVAISTDFEDGLDGWVARADDQGDPTVEITTDVVHEGAQAAMVSERKSQGSGIGRDVSDALVEGVPYELSAWLRFADGEAVDDVWVSAALTTDGQTQYHTLAQFTGMSNSEWVHVQQTFSLGAFDEASIYFETNYNGANISTFYVDDIVIATPDPIEIEDITPLKSTVDFPLGVAIDSRETVGSAAELTLRHFGQVSAENFMKPEGWYDASGQFAPSSEIDALMGFAQANDLRVYGHVLVWHSQTPDWFFESAPGVPLTDSAADQQVLDDRLRTHIFDVAKYLADAYGEFGSASNPLVAWDVVNEVVSDGSGTPGGLRTSEWFRILGEDFIDLAFAYADEAFNDVYAADGTDRPVKLFINDYNSEQSGKQQRYLDLVERLVAREAPIDGVGHQFHVSLAMPVPALEAALDAFAHLGLQQAVTEFDVTTGIPVTDAKLIDQGYYMRDAFRAFRAFDQAHRADGAGIFSVTVWGLNDSRSWRAGDGDPLLFNDRLQAKPAYYGVVDAALPAPLRTADVFQADVALGADAATAAEWDRVPLIAISADARFQSRWVSDHLTVLVEVDDLTSGADAVEVQLGGDAVTLARDGSGDASGVVTETADGYRAVIELPLNDAAQGDTLDLDVRVTDDGSTSGWNAAGVMGTLTLLEAISFVEVVQAPSAPTIDGVIDQVWADANTVTTAKQIEGDGAQAEVRTLWRDGVIYVLAEVTDPVVDLSGSDPWIQDSIEIYVDPGNVKNGSYRYDDSQIRISAGNELSFGTGDEAFQRGRVDSATSWTSAGYLVEVAIQLNDAARLGSFQGLDFQVNDAADGARTAITNWADPSGAGYQSTARWGVGELVGPADSKPGQPNVDSPTVTLGSTTVQAGGTVDVRLSGFAPGAVVDVQFDRPAHVAAGGGALLGVARGAGALTLPATLGTLTIGADGTARGSLTVPASAEPGSYRVGASVDGQLVASTRVTVLDALASTGTDAASPLAAAVLLLFAGAVLAWRGAARRRAEVL